MARRSLIDDAHRRGRILSAILLQARERAKSSPLDARWRDCGLINEGDTKQEAVETINQTFDRLSEFVSYITILDMAASFEEAVKRRLATHIGEARKKINTSKPVELPFYRQRFLRDSSDFGSLAAIWSLLEGQAGIEEASNFEAVREARNLIAHGSQPSGAPKIDVETARQTLEDLMRQI